MKKRVNHPEQRSVDLQSTASSAYASETLVRHGAIVEEIEIENEFSKVIINQVQDEEKTGYILTEFLEVID